MSLRMLAPVSLVLFGIVFLVVVVASLDGGSDSVKSEHPPAARQTPRRAQRAERTRRQNAERRVYVVKAGDTLATISERTGVPVEQLQALNPDLDPRALVTGQRVKLRE